MKDYCERVHPEGAAVLATYKTDFYAGMPALTVNKYGSGQVYYLAARPAADGMPGRVHPRAHGVADWSLARCLAVELPEGVTVQKRSGGGRTFYFLHNCRRQNQVVDLGAIRLKDVGDGTDSSQARRRWSRLRRSCSSGCSGRSRRQAAPSAAATHSLRVSS